MNILHFVHNFPPEFRGGTESYVLNLSLRQIRTGHRVRVVSGSAREDAGIDSLKELFGPVQVLRLFKRPDDGPYKVWPYFPRISDEVRKAIRTFQPDVVHVHHWHHLSDDIARIAAADRIPVVLTLHDFFSVCPRFFRAKPGADKICPSAQSPGECYDCIRQEYAIPPMELSNDLYERRTNMAEEVKAATYVYTFSRSVADFFQEIPWFPDVPIHAHPIGLLHSLRRSEPREEAFPLRLATWGGHTEVKGTHLLLEAASLPWLRDKIRVNILGRIVAGAYRDRLEGLAEACGAKLLGYFPEPEKDTLGERFDVAVFPTQAFETYSIVIDEALAMGMPVITTRPGAQSERVGEAGVVVPAGDVEALADAIDSFLDAGTRLEAARAAGRLRVGTVDDHWLRLSCVYSDLTAKGKGRISRSLGFHPFITRRTAHGAARPGCVSRNFAGKQEEKGS
ncbi:MAG: glycosyltransferase family 4 protein [Planctomycetota bacterium]|jgi:glycosyltransferase involved in cell wall biosynthesis